MNAPSFGLILILAGLGSFAGFAGWAVYAVEPLDGGWAALWAASSDVAGSVLTVGVVAALVMWLVSYSANHGR